MGFHKRYIRGEIIIIRYKSDGPESVFNLYTRGVDSLILNGELASDIDKILRKDKLNKEEILKEISKTIELSEDFKKF